MKLSIPSDSLLAQLKINRGQHRAIFEEAVEGYRAEAVRQLEDHIARIKNGSLKDVYVSLPTPEEHTADYDRIIGLIEMSNDSEIGLSESEYANYVQDDWAWKRAFITSNSYYSVTAASLAENDDAE